MSADPELMHLPEGWAWATVHFLAVPEAGALTDGPFGSNLKTSHYTDEGPRVVRLQNIGVARFIDNRAYISDAHYARLARYSVEADDVLIALLGDPPAHACLAPRSLGPAIVKADCVRLRADRQLTLPAYVMYGVNSEPVRQQVSEEVHGVGRPRVNLRSLRSVRVPIAPQSEQARIVEAIDTAFSKLDAAVTGLARVQANLVRYRASLLKAAVEGRLVSTEAELARQKGRDYEPADVLLRRILSERRRRWEEAQLERLRAAGRAPPDDRWRARYEEPVAPKSEELPSLPEGWCWATVDQLGYVSGGLTKNAKRAAHSLRLPYLRVANVYADRLDLGEVKDIGVTERELPRVLLRRGDLLVVEGNGSLDQIGRVALWDGSIDPCVHQNHLIKVRCDVGQLSRWCLFWLLSPPGRVHVVKAASSTSGLHTLSISKVATLAVPLPPLNEQLRIAADIDRALSIEQNIEGILEAAAARTDHFRQSILSWAFSGRLVDQDPNDEPASVLLDRIRAEREAAARAAPRRSASSIRRRAASRRRSRS